MFIFSRSDTDPVRVGFLALESDPQCLSLPARPIRRGLARSSLALVFLATFVDPRAFFRLATAHRFGPRFHESRSLERAAGFPYPPRVTRDR